MKAWNGEINCYCPKEQSSMVNDIRVLVAPKFSRRLSYSWGKTLEKNANQKNWPKRGSNPGQPSEKQRCYPSTTAVIYMCRTPGIQNHVARWCKPKESWQSMDSTKINLFHKHAVKGGRNGNITSKYDSVASFCCRFHGRLARWIKWRACDVGEAKEGLQNELWCRWSNGRLCLILQPLHHFSYVTAHSPTLPLLHLSHSSFYNPSVSSPTSQTLHVRHLASRPWTRALLSETWY